MEFECTSCGACCMKIGRSLGKPAAFHFMQQAKDDFPYDTREDGSCEKLIDNRCSVYDHRPLYCDIGRLADETNMLMTKKKWFDMNYKGCEELQMKYL